MCGLGSYFSFSEEVIINDVIKFNYIYIIISNTNNNY